MDFDDDEEHLALQALASVEQANSPPKPPPDEESEDDIGLIFLEMDDAKFLDTWFRMGDDEKALLSKAIRDQCRERYVKLTPWVGAKRSNGHAKPSEPLQGDDQAQDYSYSVRHLESPQTAAEWPEPVDLSRAIYSGLSLPLELAPESLQPLLADFRARTGIEPGAFFCGLMGGLSTMASDFIRLQPKQNDTTWTVRPVIWPFAIGGSSSGKTPALEAAMRFVIDKDTAEVIANSKKRKDFEYRMDQYADECAAARKNKAPRPEEPEPPQLREYWVQRGTTEGVTRVLEHSSKVIWYMGEGSGLINGWDRYASGGKGSGDREFVLMLWDGGPGKNTLAGKTVTIRNASAVICGGSTPQAMRSACAGKLQADGFLQRTLLCMVPDQAEGVDTHPDNAAIANYEQILNNLGDMLPATFRMSPDAQAIYNEFCGQVRAIIAASENESFTAHLGKWFGLAPRLMLVYYLTECAARGQLISDSDRLPAGIAHQVCRLLMDWQLSHLRQFWFELMAEKTGRSFTLAIARYILANPGLSKLNFRDHISRPHWRALEALKPWEIKESINLMVNAAWLTPISDKPNSYGVASSYEINSKIAHRFTEWRAAELVRRSAQREEIAASRNQPE